MFRYLISCIIALIFIGGIWLSYEQKEELSSFLPTTVKQKQVLTFATHFSSDDILKANQHELLPSSEYCLQRASLLYFPYVLFDAKSSHTENATEDSRLIFSLENAELVLDTSTFETSHGFEDCLNAKATSDDFRILLALEKNGGSMSKEALAKELGLDFDHFMHELDILRKKQLIVTKGDSVRIHLEHPRLKVAPRTIIASPLVTKTIERKNIFDASYSKGAIRKLAKAAFGKDFTIKKEQEIYIPFYEICIKNPDDSIHKTYWNALTGKKLEWVYKYHKSIL